MNNLVVMPNFKENPSRPDTVAVANSKLIWKQWCKNNNIKFLVLEEPICSFETVCPQYQKMWVMDILDENKIEYDELLVVDHDTYPIPTCPDMFTLSNGEFSAVLDNGFGPQLNRQMIIFRAYFFPNNKFVTWDTYFNSGVIIYSKKHREVFKATQKFFFDHRQDYAVYNKADQLNDQTPLNYILSEMGFKLNLLPRSYNVLDFHMERFLIPSYNDELGRPVEREKNIMDCIHVFHITNGQIRDAASEYLKQIIWKL